MGILEYHSNNSGGNWWLHLRHWEALERAGWIIHWIHDWDDLSHTHSKPIANHIKKYGHHHHGYIDQLVPAKWSGENWFDAAATSAAIETDDPNKAIEEFERLTGVYVNDRGCSGCGPPHGFLYTKDGKTKYLDIISHNHEREWYEF